jgi:uncharacterized repeat protein (TIGR03837 family)
MRWHLYCKVVDNFGDAGVAWRLAADLAARGEDVRLAIDDPRPLAWMAPERRPGVEVRAWDEIPADSPDAVVELFGAGLPPAVERRAARAAPAPVVVDLEHLSAEAYVERSHGLPSPRRLDSGEPLTTWFFYPGFTTRTGGLLRERGLLERRAAFDADAWLAARGIPVRPAERRASLFCYPDAPIGELLDSLAGEPTVLLLAAGAAAEAVAAALGPTLARGALRAVRLPALPQAEFDALLWSCDLNFVRGEDSLVRAIWAGAPFVWQLYRQPDGAHVAKLEAFLDRLLAASDDPSLAPAVRDAFRGWNRLAPAGAPLRLPETGASAPWRHLCVLWRDALAAQTDLTTALVDFVASKR